MVDEETKEEEQGRIEHEAQKEEQAQQEKQADLVTKANKAAERLEKANKELKSLLQQQAASKAEAILGGHSTSEHVKSMTQDEREIEAARKMLAGTGYDDELFPKK